MPVKGSSGSQRSGTASVRLYRIIRADILDLKRKPGDPIAEKDIASKHGVSRTPVREALLRLADEGLVEIVPKSGTAVARISLVQLADAILARKALEVVCVRAAAERATRSDILQLEAVIERQKEAVAARDHGSFHLADEAFHQSIAFMAGHPHIWALVEQVKIHIDRYRRMTLPVEGRMGRVILEHLDVLAGIAANAPDKAAEALSHHLDGLTLTDDIRLLNPDYFYDDIPARPAAQA